MRRLVLCLLVACGGEPAGVAGSDSPLSDAAQAADARPEMNAAAERDRYVAVYPVGTGAVPS